MKTFDTGIVGGGVVGVALAYELSQSGQRVAVFERGSLGAGTSAVNQGGVRQQFHSRINIRYAKATIDRMAAFEDEFGVGVGFRQHGYLYFISSATSRDYFREAIGRQNDQGVPSELLTPDEAAQLVPGLMTDDLIAGAYCPTDGYLDPRRVVEGFASKARELGTVFYEGCRVVGLAATAGRINELKTTKGSFACGFVINAAGPWAPAVADLYGGSLPIMARQSPIFVLASDEPSYQSIPLSVDFDRRVTICPRLPGLMVGGARKPAIAQPGPVAICDWSVAGEVRARAGHRIPPLSALPIVKGWAGFWEVTPDDDPIVGWTEFDNLYTVAGFSGHGICLVPGLAPDIAREICEGRPASRLDEYRPSRFEDGSWRTKDREIWGGTALSKLELPDEVQSS